MSDIVERLRHFAHNYSINNPMQKSAFICEAADLIERQAAEIAMLREHCASGDGEIGRLRDALKWIMKQGDGNHYGPFTSTPQELSDVARAALNEHREQPSDDPAKS